MVSKDMNDSLGINQYSNHDPRMNREEFVKRIQEELDKIIPDEALTKEKIDSVRFAWEQYIEVAFPDFVKEDR